MLDARPAGPQVQGRAHAVVAAALLAMISSLSAGQVRADDPPDTHERRRDVLR